MYVEENEKRVFPLKGFLIRLLLIIIAIFLLIVLFPIPKLDTFYDKIFSQNIATMKEAATSYFTVERLPQDQETPVKLTLKEMLDKKLLIEFTDKDGKTCDTTKSYVEVSMGDTEYEMKVFLSCSGQEDYIKVPMGCYNTCFNCKVATDVIDKIAYKYQFKRDIDKKVISSYECSNGLKQNGTKCYLEKVTVDKLDAASKTTYTCSSEYENAGTYGVPTTCTKKVTSISTKRIDATSKTTYTCSSEYENAGVYSVPTTCIKKMQATTISNKAAVGKTVYTCSNYYDNAGSYQAETTCIKTKDGTETVKTYYPTRSADLVRAYTTKDCDTCSSIRWYVYKTKTVSKASASEKTTYICSSEYENAGTYTVPTTCTKKVASISTDRVNAASKTEYTCSSEYENAGTYTVPTTCTKKVTSISTDRVNATSKTEYTCSSEYDNAGTYNVPTTCTKKTIVTSISEATAIYKTVKLTEYKWTTKTSLSGWKYTGISQEI